MAFQYFPEPDNPEIPRGPANWAKDLWIEEMPYAVRKQRGHFHHQDIAICIGAAGTGKCFAKGTTILMYSGEVKPVENIVPGDLVMGPDSLPRRVESLARGRERMYMVIPDKGESFVCNESHILSLKQSGNKKARSGKIIRRTGDVINISVKDYLACGKSTQKDWKLYRSGIINFPEASPVILNPYYLGLWLGGGSKHSQAITNVEPEIISFLHSFAATEGCTLEEIENTESDCSSWYASTGARKGNSTRFNPIRQKLTKLNLLLNKHIPESYLRADYGTRMLLLAGLLDSDGWLDEKNGYYGIIQKSEQLAKEICFLVRSLGLAANLTPIQKSCTYKGEKITGQYFKVTVCGHIESIPVRVERKKSRRLKHTTNNLVTGFKLKELPIDDYYGFEISGPDRLFLLGDFTVVHNSMNSASRGIHLARKWRNGRLVIGAMNRPQLDRNQIQYWAKIYGMNGNGNPWGHKEITRVMTDKRQWNEHNNGTIVYFLNFDLWHTVQGIAAGFILVEEANNLKSIQSYYALLSRFRTMSMPLWQMILLANPRLSHNWMLDAFDLRQFMPGYRGPKKPIGKPCNCQYCPACIQHDKIEVEWVDDECPRCGVVNNRPPKIRYCRNCRATKKKLVKYDGLQCPDCGWYKCPGEQYFHRLIHSTLKDNQFADESMEQNMRSTMSALQFKLLGEGQILDTNTGTIHVSWNDSVNILPTNIKMDYDREIHWCQDFNNDPMTTVLAQVYSDNGEPNIYVVDEIISFRSTVQDSVDRFVERYGDYKGKVIIWGDPAGYAGGIKDKVLDRYEQICQALDDAHIDYELRAVNTPMPIQSRLDTLNYHLQDATEYTRLYFNPQATWTIESVRGVIWNKQGTKEDETNDRHVAELARLGEIPPGVPGPDIAVKALTHPQAALGYWLNLEYPQVQWAEPVAWHKEPDGTIVEFRRDEMVIKRPGEQGIDLESFDPSRHTLDGMMADMDDQPSTLWSDIRDDGNHFWFGWSP